MVWFYNFVKEQLRHKTFIIWVFVVLQLTFIITMFICCVFYACCLVNISHMIAYWQSFWGNSMDNKNLEIQFS